MLFLFNQETNHKALYHTLGTALEPEYLRQMGRHEVNPQQAIIGVTQWAMQLTRNKLNKNKYTNRNISKLFIF